LKAARDFARKTDHGLDFKVDFRHDLRYISIGEADINNNICISLVFAL
jgi:hypothetical protein